MKPEDARLTSVAVGCAVVWMDTFAFADYGLLPVMMSILQGVAVWSLLKLRRVDDGFYMDDLVSYAIITVGLDAMYALVILTTPTFSSAIVVMLRTIQFVLMLHMFPKTFVDRRPPYPHWLETELKRENDLPWRQELHNVFSFETRNVREVPSIEI